MEYDEYLTSDEKKQIDELMNKAEERRRKKMEDDASNHFLLLDCQCLCMKKMQEKEGERAQDMPSDCFERMQEFLKMLCNFCREHRCCEYHKNKESVGNEELPFP